MNFYVWIAVAAAILIVSYAVSMFVMRRQQEKELDKGMNATSVKHQILANPALIAYVLFPVVIVIGAAILMYYYH